LAMSMVVRHPEQHAIVPALIGIAQEELEHFADVYRVMRGRGVDLVPDIKDPYVERLYAHVRHGRESRFLDRLLVSSVIECRGAERFGIIAASLDDAELRDFYQRLWRAEIKHGHQFADMALKVFDEDIVLARLRELMSIEAEIVEQLDWRPSLH
ncbi:MAG: tRNA-(ms[2]io[6]A)-hydroxylase, partial [Gammaproteobacteria bacterium]|nr:tRNA-(ms[2]io[6]A)-hydroxylase [Gammaproteobacteria bacterium]